MFGFKKKKKKKQPSEVQVLCFWKKALLKVHNICKSGIFVAFLASLQDLCGRQVVDVSLFLSLL